MLFTVEELRRHTIKVSKTYAPGVLDYRGAEFRQSSPLRVDAVAELSGASEIRVGGHLGTRLETSCDRCVGPVDLLVEQDFDLFYRPLETVARNAEVEIPEDESEIGFYSGEGVELEEVVREQVLLAVPMKIICRHDCRGLCPVCGANRNVKPCHCSAPRDDSPFASLR